MRVGINELPIIFQHQIADMWGAHLAERILGLLKLMLTMLLLRYTIVWPTFISHFNDLCRWKYG
jgi:hypothetical protein